MRNPEANNYAGIFSFFKKMEEMTNRFRLSWRPVLKVPIVQTSHQGSNHFKTLAIENMLLVVL